MWLLFDQGFFVYGMSVSGKKENVKRGGVKKLAEKSADCQKGLAGFFDREEREEKREGSCKGVRESML
jgi:hypothetical protein